MRILPKCHKRRRRRPSYSVHHNTCHTSVRKQARHNLRMLLLFLVDMSGTNAGITWLPSVQPPKQLARSGQRAQPRRCDVATSQRKTPTWPCQCLVAWTAGNGQHRRQRHKTVATLQSTSTVVKTNGSCRVVELELELFGAGRWALASYIWILAGSLA